MGMEVVSPVRVDELIHEPNDRPVIERPVIDRYELTLGADHDRVADGKVKVRPSSLEQYVEIAIESWHGLWTLFREEIAHRALGARCG